MNLRISTDEFKVRLSREEMTDFKNRGTISQTFPVGPNANLEVNLLVGGKVATAHQNARGIDIEVPESVIEKLVNAKIKKECEHREAMDWGSGRAIFLVVEIDAFTLK